MGYALFGEEFIDKTKKIINDYQCLFGKEIENNEGYEITLLLNCMLGLAAFPSDRYYNDLSTKDIFADKVGTICGVRITDPKSKRRNVKQATHAIRNTVAHFGDQRKEYPSKIYLNGKDISKYNDIGRVKTIQLTCGKKDKNKKEKDDWTIFIDLGENKNAFSDFLFRLCEIMLEYLRSSL